MTRFSRDQRLGLRGERWAMRQLEARGYQVKIFSNWFADVDLLVNGTPCEVKISSPRLYRAKRGSYRQRWQWNVSRGMNGEKIDHLVILIALDDAGRLYPFIVPSWFAKQRLNIQIASHPTVYRGWLSEYLDAWAVVDQVIAVHQTYVGQMSFFEEFSRALWADTIVFNSPESTKGER